jgi:hypothetical protein
MIALSPDPIDSFNITILISLLHTTTSNENKYSQRNATSLHPPPYALSVPAFSPGKTRKSTLSSSRMSTTKLARCSLVRTKKGAECGFVSDVLDHHAAIASTPGCPCGTRHSNYQHRQPILCSHSYPLTSFRSPKRKVCLLEGRHPLAMKHHRHTTSATHSRCTPSCTVT